MTSLHIGRVQELLLAWVPDHFRDLPWRATRDPWRIHVSEVMLQQTQVDRVIPRYQAFVDRFPTVADCAAASPAEVIGLWDGLGYNRRALLLHRAASMVAERFDGRYPHAHAELRELPGVGPCTSRAIATFAFEHDVGVVDTNVGRTLARLSGTSLSPPVAQRLADDLVPQGDGWKWNQAMFDLGASVCTKRVARCDECPLREQCAWQGVGADPAVRSAGVTGPQSRFEGSDRQGRGQLIKRLRSGSIAERDSAAAMGWADDPERARRTVAGLIADGMVERSGDHLALPGHRG